MAKFEGKKRKEKLEDKPNGSDLVYIFIYQGNDKSLEINDTAWKSHERHYMANLAFWKP